MAPRIGFTFKALRQLHPAACCSDARFVWKSGDGFNWGIVYANGDMVNLRLSGVRELRLLAAQMNAIADHAERANRSDPFEVVLP